MFIAFQSLADLLSRYDAAVFDSAADDGSLQRIELVRRDDHFSVMDAYLTAIDVRCRLVLPLRHALGAQRFLHLAWQFSDLLPDGHVPFLFAVQQVTQHVTSVPNHCIARDVPRLLDVGCAPRV